MHRAIKFNLKSWLKPYINLNTEPRRKAENDYGFFMLTSNAVFGKTMENVRKHSQRYQACNNQSKDELFGIITELSY